MDYRNFTAKTVDEAITQACLELGVTSDRLDYKVVQEATSGFLGIGSKPAIISAGVKEEEPEKEISAEEVTREEIPEVKPAVSEEKKEVKEEVKEEPEQKSVRYVSSDEIEKRAAAAAAKAKTEGISEETHTEKSAEGRRRERTDSRRTGRSREDRYGDRRHSERTYNAEPVVRHEPSKPKPERVVKERTDEEAAELITAAETFLKDVFEAMGIKAEISTGYIKEEGAVSCTFSGDEMGLLIGKRGQTLDSLQYLTSLVVNKKTDDYVRVKLDTEDYRSRRAETLNNLARNIAYKVKKSRRPVALEPMNPYERRIIHSALQSNKFVETYSEGEEPYRHVVVAPKW